MPLSRRPKHWTDRAREDGAWIVPEALFDGQNLCSGRAVLVQGNRATITDAAEIATGPEDTLWRARGILTPGFFDLQVNGGGGVLLNGDPSPAGVLAIARAHRTTGTAALLPTVITDRAEVTEAAAAAILRTVGQDGIAGIHVEGPHISPSRRGTHKAEYIRPLDARTMTLVAGLRANNVPVMITLAPEAVAPGQIATLVGQGVVVAIGHSDASAAQTRAALAEGAQSFTHLFNAMSQMQNREAGVTGAAINSQAYCSMICDGIHVAPEMLALAIRARPVADRMIVVTDAMPTVAGPDSYTLYGQTITLRDGRLLNADGALAGAHVTMLESVGFLIHRLSQTPEQALRMAITNPARLMGVQTSFRLENMPPDDLLLIAPDFASAGFILDGDDGF